ncbi:MAG: 2-oxoglutarate oxidoreductase [Synergistaceae bacterium]|jgi:2-oxoglutarate ferredoxin oxidoreductase subunit beta|nr:2-oxoglutarate oxidoreductase [Synergistaceae bacterium]
MSETQVFNIPKVCKADVHTHYCPGCTHGVAHRLVCEAIEELGLQNKVMGIAPVGCAVLMHEYMDLDFIEAPHGRAPALASGMKAVRPDKIVFTYQGDGDLASIGMGEIVHTMNRGLPLTIIFINNAIYGMTGGQMAPTTLLGQKSTTSPAGRTAKASGYPIRMCELLATLEGPAYIERAALTQPKYIVKAKQAVLKAFKNQAEGKGMSFVELLSTCPTNWGARPVDACKWLEDNMMPYYPLGVYKDFK